MGEFQPSVNSAKNALGNSIQIERRSHPGGSQGVSVSLNEICKRIMEGRLDPRIRAWVGEVLIKAGKPEDIINKAQAILDAVRARTVYAPDPTGAEYMVAAKNTLCLDEFGLCMRAGDCDDLTIALGSALMSIDIPIKIIGQSFDSSPIPSHVMLAIQSASGWKRIDPSSSTFSVGKSYPATYEKWVDPLDEVPSSSDGTVAGDFIGIGAPPTDPSIAQSAIANLSDALATLENGVASLAKSINEIEHVRSTLYASSPYDPEPVGGVHSVSDFPVDGSWTANMATISVQTLNIGTTLVHAAREALDGLRNILIDEKNNEVYVEAKKDDPWSLHTIIQSASDTIVGFFDSAGQLISGFSTKDGRALSKDQIDAQIQQKSGSVGNPVVVALVAVGAAIAAVVMYYAVTKICRTVELSAREATNKSIMKCVTSGKCSSKDAKDILDALNKGRAAEDIQREDPLASTLGSIGTIVKWTVIGGVVVAGVYYGTPIVKGLIERYRTRALPPATQQ